MHGCFRPIAVIFYLTSIDVSGLTKNANGIANGPKRTTTSLRPKFVFTFLAFEMKWQMIALSIQIITGTYASIFNSHST